MHEGSVFASRSFRRLFVAQTVSRWGDTFNQVALLVLVFRLTGSGLRVAGVVAFEIVPVLLLAPWAGTVSDRFSKRTIMIAADLSRAALVVVLVAAPHQLALVYAVAFGLAAGSVFFNPASGALLPALVHENQLVRANSALWSAAVTSQIALAPVAGVLVASVGPRAAFALNAASFVGSAAFLRGLPDDAGPPPRMRLGRQVIEGLALVRTDPLVRVLSVVQALAALSAGATSALLIVLAQQRLDLGPSGFGLLLSAIGVGAAIGPLTLRLAKGRQPSVRWLSASFGLRGAVDFVLATTREPLVAAGTLGLYGIGTSTGMVVYQTIVQSDLDERVRGRAFSLLDAVWQTSRLVSLAAGGVVADRLGIATVYLIGGAALLVAAIAGVWGGRASGASSEMPSGQ
jgi:predicted MFS family arabinose efflux permease